MTTKTRLAEYSEEFADILFELVELPSAEAQAAYIDGLPREYQSLREELVSLAAAHSAAGDFLEQPALLEASAVIPEILGESLVGTQLGSWHLDELIGCGGMGSVFRSTRVEDAFTQRGAIKVVRAGLETSELVSRFSQERQLLAKVEHPHVARLLDGGTTADGLPWLAMEYVDGLPIDRYADGQKLSVVDRINLFQRLCDAVAYLHQNLITHLDLKASNVLVDADGHVRVLDFGIADLLDASAPKNFERAWQRASLATAAPEQLQGKQVSTSTDIYALGLLLYRLLAGISPYDLSSDLDSAKIEQLIVKRPAPKASVRFGQAKQRQELASRRATGVKHLTVKLNGDLDAILGRCLEKKPIDRYQSVTELQRDLERYLLHLPVLARPPTTAYRAQKFLRRHWLGLSATALVGLALCVGLLATLWQAQEVRKQRDRAEAMNNFMREVLAEAKPYNAGEERTVRDALIDASSRLDTRFRSQPLTELALRQTVGGIQVKLMDLDSAAVNLTKALTLADAHVATDHLERLRTEAHLAWSYYEQERFDESIALYGSIIDRLTPSHPNWLQCLVHNDLGVSLNRMGRYEEAVKALERSLQYIGSDIKQHASILINLGYAYGYLEQLDAAESYYLQAIGLLDSLGEEGQHAEIAYLLNNYGRVLAKLERTDEALTAYRSSLELRIKVFGAEADATGAQHLNVGRLLLDLQRATQARTQLEQAVAILGQYRSDDSFYMNVAIGSLARAKILSSEDSSERRAAEAQLRARLLSLEQDPAIARTKRFVDQFRRWLQEYSED